VKAYQLNRARTEGGMANLPWETTLQQSNANEAAQPEGEEELIPVSS